MKLGKVRLFALRVSMGALLTLSSGFLFAFPAHAQTTTETSTPSDTLPLPPAPTSHLSRDVEAKVRTTFIDLPVMIAIAKCESGFRQFTDAGNVLHGGLGGEMIGVFQFHSSSHARRALALGYDIDTLDGNIAYARYLYNQAGTDPWVSSFDCWHSTANNTNSSRSTDLRFGMENGDVFMLQQQLNRAGFTLASSGPGSPGNETKKFGNFTRAAVRRFQCAEGIACSGDEYTTGYGLVGDRTRAVLSSLLQNSPAPSPITIIQTTVNTPDRSAEIARLQAQIAELLKLVAALEAQLAVAHSH